MKNLYSMLKGESNINFYCNFNAHTKFDSLVNYPKDLKFCCEIKILKDHLTLLCKLHMFRSRFSKATHSILKLCVIFSKKKFELFFSTYFRFTRTKEGKNIKMD